MPNAERRGMSRAILPVAAALGLHAALVGIFVAAYHGDLSALVCLDRARVGVAPYQAVRVGFPSGGYDGQFYYVIAQAPWRHFDLPHDSGAFRQMRILYPALAWALTAGDPHRLLWVLPGLNLLAIAGLAWLGVRLAGHHGLSGWWGFVLPLAVNDGLPLLRDLTDPLATFAVCGLLVSWLQGRRDWSLALWGAAAAFSREQNVAVVAVVLAAALWRRHFAAAAGLAAVLGLWGGWICVLKASYGGWPFPHGDDFYFGSPFKGMLFRWAHLDLSGSRVSGVLHLLRMLLLSLHLALAVYLAVRGGSRVVGLVALGGVVLAVLTGIAAYEDAWSYTRVFAWVPLTVWLAAVQVRRIGLLCTLIPTAAWPMVAVVAAWVR
jgi:hypothetical protein